MNNQINHSWTNSNNSSNICSVSEVDNNTCIQCPTQGIHADVFSMARAFLCIDSMTHKKLQKLCYYAKAWYLALNDENILFEDFQAWVHGAVQPELYSYYKSYGFSVIPQNKSSAGIPEEFMSFAHEIYNTYGCFSGDELEEINHTEMPWKKARGNLKPWEKCTVVISEDDMKDYYRSMLKNE